MNGWIILAVAFFLFGAGCFIDALVHRSKTEQALRQRDEARVQRDNLNTERSDLIRQRLSMIDEMDKLHEAVRTSRDERATLKLQLAEATKPKERTPRASTKKERIEP